MMMIKITEEVSRQLNEKYFLSYLELMYDQLGKVHHRDKTDSAYEQCQDAAHHIHNRIVHELGISWDDFKRHFNAGFVQTEKILRRYKFSDSDRKKADRIGEFVYEYRKDLEDFIKDQRQKKNSNPSSI